MRVPMLLVAAVLTAAGCSSDRPGNPAVYDRIDGLSDCGALQQEFDTAAAGHDRATPGSDQAEAATSYMQAAQDRMDELGC